MSLILQPGDQLIQVMGIPKTSVAVLLHCLDGLFGGLLSKETKVLIEGKGARARARSPSALANQSSAEPGTGLSCGMIHLPSFLERWFDHEGWIFTELLNVTFGHDDHVFCDANSREGAKSPA
jgi:hypothetical protein